MAKFSLDFVGFDEVLKKFAKLEADAKPVADEALTKTHEIITKKAEAAIAKANLPAGGKYSTGDTEKSIVRDPKITWKGTEGSVSIGFNIKKGGLASIFLMYGTPRMVKVQELYDAFWSEQTEGEIMNTQKEIFMKALEELEG
jgi:hypothetical protein